MPGGGLDRAYYDLRAGGGTRFSFAVQMAERGCITIAIDPLGIGGSTRPRRGFELTADVHARALARLHDTVCARLRAGSLIASLPPLRDLVSIGVGHSVGALLVLFQQAAERSYDALALLGFGTGGLVAALDEELRKYAGDPAGARANATRLAERWYADPYPVLDVEGRGREIYGGRADPEALQALRGCRAPLLATVAVFVIIPGSSAPEAACVDVPRAARRRRQRSLRAGARAGREFSAQSRGFGTRAPEHGPQPFRVSVRRRALRTHGDLGRIAGRRAHA